MEERSRPAAAGADRVDAADLQAVSETLRGNADAFRAIVDRHGPLVLRLSLSFLRSREEAEEACQEIFFKAFRSLQSYDLGKAFLPWLYAVAINYLRTRYRRNRRRQDQVVDLERGIPFCDEVSDPSSLAEQAEIQGQLLRAVEALPPGIREAVALYYYGGMNVSGVAEVMGLGVENVKSRLHRGRKAVRAYLGRRDATMPPAREYTPVRRSERGSCHG